MDRKNDGSGYAYVGAISSELEKLEDSIGTARGILLLISILLALFSLFVFCHFMMTSITNKRREIGIMRSMGASKTDIHRIFGTESGVAGVMIFAFSMLITVLLVYMGNLTLQRNIGIGTNVLHFGLRQILLLLLLSVISTIIAARIPIINLIKKKPIELIREL